jgi:hypothetical protein
LSSYILAGIDYECNSLVSSIATRVEPVTFVELYSQLLTFETRLDLQNQGSGGGHPPSSTNTTSLVVEASPEGAVVVAHEVVATQEIVVVVMQHINQGTSFPLASYVGEQIIRYSSATSGLTHHTWERRRVSIQLIFIV